MTKRELGDQIYENKNRINEKVGMLYNEVIDVFENSDPNTSSRLSKLR